MAIKDPIAEPTTRRRAASNLFEPRLIKRAVVDAFIKLDPRHVAKNPVMFVVEVGSAVTTYMWIRDMVAHNGEALFTGQLMLWLWFTVLFANFAEAMAEGRGKAQADSLRKARTTTTARKLLANDKEEAVVQPTLLVRGDQFVCEAGDPIPADGEIIDGIASVDESAITGESAPVIRESGGDRSAVTGGTRVLSDRIVVRVTANPGESFLDRMIALVEGAQRQKTPNEIALSILLSGLTIIFLFATVTLLPFAKFSVDQAGKGDVPSIAVLVALLVCLIPTTIGGLLSAIGIAGMDRVMQHNVLAMSGKAVEAAGDVNTLLLDKTGTITLGNREATAFHPAPGVDETPGARRSRPTVVCWPMRPLRADQLWFSQKRNTTSASTRDAMKDMDAEFVPFTAQTRMSGVDIGGKPIRKGASEAVRLFVESQGGKMPAEVATDVERISREGGTPLVVCEGNTILGTVQLKDIVKGGMKARFAQTVRAMGIKTVMITGDNPLTAASIAAEAGVDDFLAEATPEMKLAYIRQEQSGGRLVAMTGDGTNDAPALAQADVGVAMNTGTQPAKEAGNMVDLDSNPTKLIEIVEIGKALLMTRGALTTFSIANDVAKYFAIIPAMFLVTYPALGALNVIGLTNPHSAILAAVIFNALIIIALIPLALRGVKYTPMNATAILRRNLWIYGFGGILIPFPGIWILDRLLVLCHLA